MNGGWPGRLFERSLPFVPQLTVQDCGVACLAMVLAHHGRWMPVEELRALLPSDRGGTTAADLKCASTVLGLKSRLARIELHDLALIPRGTILHWSFRHFVVFEKQRRGRVTLLDPGCGRRVVGLDEFSRHFTGVALLTRPGPTFERRPPPALSLASWWPFVARPRLLARVVFLSVLLQLFGFIVPVTLSAIVDHIVPRQDRALLQGILSLSALVGCSILLAQLMRGHLLAALRSELDLELSANFFSHLVRLPLLFFQRRAAGDLLMRLGSFAMLRELITSALLTTLLDGLLGTVYLLLLVLRAPSLACVAFGSILLQVLVYALAVSRRRELTAAQLSTDAVLQSFQSEILGGIESVKGAAAEWPVTERWSALARAALNNNARRARFEALLDGIFVALRTATPLCIMILAARLVLDRTISLGAMLMNVALAGGALGPISNLFGALARLPNLTTYLERSREVLEASPESVGRDRTGRELDGGIVAENVSFRYQTAGPAIVDRVNFTIAPGSLLAIVGRTGCGKSTLARLIHSTLSPEGGVLRYDGVAHTDVDLGQLRRQVALVPQGGTLLTGTVRDNIALASPDLSHDRIVEAARLAQLHDEIAGWPLGYDMPLLSGGLTISGGQKQKVLLARALVRRPKVLILDEATSAMDPETEAGVCRSLASLGCTRILITHRLASVKNADRILVMAAGRVVEAGTHEELMARKDHYWRLHDPAHDDGGAG